MQVHIGGFDFRDFSLGFELIKGMLEKYPRLKEVRMDIHERLRDEDADSFGKCPNLEKIKIRGVSVSFVKRLLERLPNLRELTVIATGRFAAGDAGSFGQCPELKKVWIGRWQDISFIDKLLGSLPKLKELTIVATGKFAEGNADSFGQCPGLEKVWIDGERQNISFVKELLKMLPKLKELKINVGEQFTEDDAGSFGQCPGLERVRIDGPPAQRISFVKELLRQLPEIKDLRIRVDEELDESVGEVFRESSKLQHLVVTGCLMPGFLKSVLRPQAPPQVSPLKQLTVNETNDSQPPSAEDEEAVEAAKARGVMVRF
ncbi:MAG: hypothetical protein MRJ68_18080 [Nitrospira sp.]|nr:hypothetical protein [Nitrospira sp.]